MALKTIISSIFQCGAGGCHAVGMEYEECLDFPLGCCRRRTLASPCSAHPWELSLGYHILGHILQNLFICLFIHTCNNYNLIYLSPLHQCNFQSQGQ